MIRKYYAIEPYMWKSFNSITLVRHIKIIMIYHFLFIIFRRVVKYKWQAYGQMDILTQHQWEHNRLSKKIGEGIKKWTHLHYVHKCKCKAKTCKAVRVFGEHGYPDGDGEQGYQTSVCVRTCVCARVGSSQESRRTLFFELCIHVLTL